MFVLGRDQGADAQPSIVVAAEHYNMLVRMVAAGVPVKLRVNVQHAVPRGRPQRLQRAGGAAGRAIRR